MAPKWTPKGSQNRLKLDRNIDRNSEDVLDRFLDRFWTVCGTMWEVIWHQNGNDQEQKFEKVGLYSEKEN